MLIVACTIPPGLTWAVEAWGYDVLSYHLELPREWLAIGRMTGLEHNVYSYLPSLAEAGYMLIGAMRGSVYDAIYAAQLFHGSLADLNRGHHRRTGCQILPESSRGRRRRRGGAERGCRG